MTDTVRQPANCAHAWIPVPVWIDQGRNLEGYRRLWCWKCRITVDVPARKEKVANG